MFEFVGLFFKKWFKLHILLIFVHINYLFNFDHFGSPYILLPEAFVLTCIISSLYITTQRVTLSAVHHASSASLLRPIHIHCCINLAVSFRLRCWLFCFTLTWIMNCIGASVASRGHKCVEIRKSKQAYSNYDWSWNVA